MPIDQLFVANDPLPTTTIITASAARARPVATSVAKHATDGPADGARLNRHASWYFRQLDALARDEMKVLCVARRSAAASASCLPRFTPANCTPPADTRTTCKRHGHMDHSVALAGTAHVSGPLGMHWRRGSSTGCVVYPAPVVPRCG